MKDKAKTINRVVIVALAIALAYETYEVYRLSKMAERCEIRK